MKILTKKKQDKILTFLVTNEIIAIKGLNRQCFECFNDNSVEAVYAIGGEKGLQKLENTVENWIKKYEGEQNDR